MEEFEQFERLERFEQDAQSWSFPGFSPSPVTLVHDSRTAVVATKKRNRMLCQRCRHDKQGCHPQDRNWDRGEKCDHCAEHGYECGPLEKAPFKQRKKRAATGTHGGQSNPYSTLSSDAYINPRLTDIAVQTASGSDFSPEKSSPRPLLAWDPEFESVFAAYEGPSALQPNLESTSVDQHYHSLDYGIGDSVVPSNSGGERSLRSHYQCERKESAHHPDLAYCLDCDKIFCYACWDKDDGHLEDRTVSHSRADISVVRALRNFTKRALERQRPREVVDGELVVVTKDTELTAWFEVLRDSESFVFKDFDRYAALMGERAFSTKEQSYPAFVSFFGEDDSEKSALINLLIDLKRDTSEGGKAAEVSTFGSACSTSRGVHLYADPSTLRTDVPILYADCETPGFHSLVPRSTRPSGRDHDPEHTIPGQSRYSKERIQPQTQTSTSEIRWPRLTNLAEPISALDRIYPRLLHTFADVEVVVVRGSGSIEYAFKKWLEWTDHALPKNSTSPILPYAIFVVNAGFSSKDPRLSNVDDYTNYLLDSIYMDATNFKTFKIQSTKSEDTHRLTARSLVPSYFSGFRAIRISDVDQPIVLLDQILQLHAEIMGAVRKSHQAKLQRRLRLNVEEYQYYMDSAFLDFGEGLEYPGISRLKVTQPGATEVASTDSEYGTEMRSSFQEMPVVDAYKVLPIRAQARDCPDIETVYSSNTSVQSIEKVYFVEKIAELLYEDLGGKKLNNDHANMISRHLTDLLADFALRLGQRKASVELRRAMVLIHKYRSQVRQSFEELISSDIEERSDSGAETANVPPTAKMQVNELMQMWHEHNTVDQASLPETLEVKQINIPDESFDLLDDLDAQEELLLEQSLTEPDTYTRLVSAHPSYQWLVARLRTIVSLDFDNCDAYEAVRSCVLQSIRKPNVIRSGQPITQVKAIFNIELPFRRFIQEQLPQMGVSGGLRHILTLTGASNQAQALPCGMYLQQTWPETGNFTLQIIEESLMSTDSPSSICQRPDGTILSAKCQDAVLSLEVLGQRNAVVEIAEQLAWMSAAFDPSLPASRTSYCTPSLHHLRKSSISHQRYYESLQLRNQSIEPILFPQTDDESAFIEEHTFKINITNISAGSKTDAGDCWHSMFGNAVLVHGFPIARRSDSKPGMEIPLNIIAGLIGTRYVNEHNGTLILKGFSALLAPTDKSGDTIVWHFCYNRYGHHLAYTDCKIPIHVLNIKDLEGSRHVVGWCTQVENLSSSEASDRMLRSGLAEVRPGCIFDNQCLRFGFAITKEPSFILLERHKSIHLASGLYFRKLEYLQQQFVLLWDVSGERGWLINGLDAFLLLARAYVRPYSGSLGGGLRVLLTNLGKIAHVIQKTKAAVPPDDEDAETEFVIRSTGPSLDPSEDPETTALAQEIFYDYLDQMYDAVDKMICMQEEIEHIDSRRKPRSLRLLEGWDFSDLTNQHGPKRPRVMTLPSVAFTWARCLRSLNTVTIFGADLGDLISPSSTCIESATVILPESQVQDSTKCRCSGLPRGGFHVAASIQDINNRLQHNLIQYPGHILLNNNAVLSSPTTIFAACVTKETGMEAPSHLDCVQMLWPAEHTQLLCKELDIDQVRHLRQQVAQSHNGAIMFGHDHYLEWYLDEYGRPVKGTPPEPVSELEDLFHDSGVGSSMGASPSRERSMGQTDPGSDLNSHSHLVRLPSSSLGQTTYGNSEMSGGQAIYGNIVYHNANITNNHAIATTQTQYKTLAGDNIKVIEGSTAAAPVSPLAGAVRKRSKFQRRFIESMKQRSSISKAARSGV